jgi:Fe-S cluster assembly ATP-binding protein
VSKESDQAIPNSLQPSAQSARSPEPAEGVSDRGLRINDLRVSVAGNQILKGINLAVEPGRVHALMGPNGSGKSTLAFALTGHPNYHIESGAVTLDGEDLLGLGADKRARAGLFLSFQYPAAIPGVKVANFLHAARQAVRPGSLTPSQFRTMLMEKMDSLDMDPAFLGRYLNDGFSGGEKKRLEMLQLAIIAPKYAILDETDSGLDVDALRAVGESVNALRKSDEGKDTGFLIITHYPRILQHITADVVHVMMDGRIVKEGDASLALRIEREGYDVIREEIGQIA